MQDSEVAAGVHRRRRDDEPEAVALAAAALRAAALVKFSPDPVIGFTADGVITEWNPAAERMYGHTAQQAVGQNVDIIVPPELSANGLFARVQAGETVGSLDTQSMTSTGERVDVSISMSPIVDERGEAVGVAGFTRDIGVRVLADERLRRSEMLLTEAQELTSIGSWEWDLITDEVVWSAELYRILGLDPDRVVPSLAAYAERIHPDDRKANEREISAVLATGAVSARTCRIVGGDGVQRITQMRARATTDATGTVVRLNGTTQDVSELVRATQSLEHANRRNEALLNSAGDGIYGIDRHGRTVFANPAAALLTGYDVGELLAGDRRDTFRHTRPGEGPYAPGGSPVAESLQDGTVHRCDADVMWRRDGSSFPVEYTSTPIFEDNAVVGAVVVFKDISERRELERAKDAFVASISHELRTPLTSIRGYLELFADEASGPLTAQQRRYLGVVERNADRLLRVVGDLLLVAQVDAGAIELELEDVDAAGVIRHGLEAAAPLAAAKGLELVAHVAANPVLRGDRARLGQVVDNLVSNAIKFTPVGGRVTVRCRAVADRVVLEVADTGLGMSADEQDQLFERFYRTAAAAEHAIQGTGLGLTIAKAFVEAHDGAISVTSASGAGTTVRVELPVAGPAPRETA